VRIVVLYPRGQKTGGPEAVHQLVDELRNQGADAYVCPFPATRDLPRVPEFAHYDAPEVDWDDLTRQDLLVGAEINVRELLAAPTERRVMWWLSVDNAAHHRYTRMVRDPFRRHEARAVGAPALLALLARELWWRFRIKRERRIEHIAQSEYARRFAERQHHRDALLVSDYTVGLPAPTADVPRDPRRVAYNPAKGGDLVEQVRAGAPDLEFVPLAGLGPEELATTLRGSGVYLDLGHHPGKDRIPREAAVLGCAVIVARRGSAAFDEDVPLPPEYKVDVEDLVDDARATLLDTTRALDRAVAAQRGFREQVGDERTRFAEEVKAFNRHVRSTPRR
jgi:hypothetical protein